MFVHDNLTVRMGTQDRIGRLDAVSAGLSEAISLGEVAHVVVDGGIAALDACAGSVSLVSADGPGHAGIAASRDAGFAEPLTKPVDASRLEAAIRRAVR